MKKICYVTTIPLTLEMFVLESAKYIYENTGWDITFVCDYDSEFANNLPKYIHYHPIKMKRGISLNGFKATLEMKKFFKKQKFDLVQYSTPNASFYAAVASKLAMVPVRLYCQWGLAYVGFTGLKRTIFKVIEKIVCSLSTCIEPDSFSNLDFSHREGLYSEDKGHVIWNGSACGVDLQKFNYRLKPLFNNEIRNKYSIEKDAFVFGFVGRITGDKGINELLMSMQHLINKYKDIYLLLVGPNDADGSIDRELIKWSTNSKHVIYVGFTQNVEKYLASMDCFVLPSYREGFGMSVIEAEAMEVPVIVTEIPGPIDAIKKDVTGITIPKADQESLERAMESIMNANCKKMGKCGREFVQSSFEQSKFMNYIVKDRMMLMRCEND